MSTSTSRSLYKYGPWFVALGAALWGTESGWRIPLVGENHHFDPAVVVFWEHAILVTLFCPILFLRRQEFKKMSLATYGYLIFSGVIGSAIGTVFFTQAIDIAIHLKTTSAVNVLLNIQPVFSTIAAWLLFKERLSKEFIPLALIAILAGCLIGMEDPTKIIPDIEKREQLFTSLRLTLLCAMCWGLSTVAGRGLMLSVSFALGSALRFVVGFISITIILLVQNKMKLSFLYPTEIFAHPQMSILLLLGLAIFSGGIPTFIYFLGLKYTKASIAGYFEMMQTLAALLVTWLLPAILPAVGYASSPLYIHQIIAGLILILAVALIQWQQNKMEQEAQIPKL